MLVLDSGGFGRLSERSKPALALIRELRDAGLWPPIVSTMVLVESLQGHPGRDANANRFLKTIKTEDVVTVEVARRAAELRRRAQRGSAVDALVVALAEPNGVVLTGDEADIGALAAHAVAVAVAVELI
jgi:ABC-type sugar transport system substrate-binding protein